MPKLMTLVCVVWLCGLSGLVAQSPTSYTPESVTNPKDGGRGYVSDPGQRLSAATVTQLNSIISDLEQTSTVQMAVVVLPSIGDQVPKDFATELFAAWGIGRSENDNGLLLLTVLDQRRTEIETGYGMEATLPDIICYRVLLEEFVPQAQAGNLDAAVLSTVQRIDKLLREPAALAELKADTDPFRSWPRVLGRRIFPPLYYYVLVALLFTVGLLTWVGLTLVGKSALYDKYRHTRYATSWVFILLFPLPYLGIYFILRLLLHRLRVHPRYSPLNGMPMRRLNEQEDDALLTAGQVVEEEIGSTDYDVWITEDGSDILVLPYSPRSSRYRECPECHFRTFTQETSTVIRAATYSRAGLKELHSECKNCHYQQHRQVEIPMQVADSGGGSRGFGGSSGGSSFGGGSSGGGGAGASW